MSRSQCRRIPMRVPMSWRRRLAVCVGLVNAACGPTTPPPAVPEAPVGGALAAALAGADSVRVADVAPGVTHAFAWDARGPWAVHVVRVALRECIRFEARKAEIGRAHV